MLSNIIYDYGLYHSLGNQKLLGLLYWVKCFEILVKKIM